MPKRSLKSYPGRVKLIIGKPVDVKSYTIENRHELIDKVRKVIITNYDYWRETGTSSIKDMEEKTS